MLDPVFLDLGFVQIKYYGLYFLMSFIIIIFYLNFLRKKNKLNLTKNQIYDLVIYSAVGIIVGARLFATLIWHPSDYFPNLFDLFKVWQGGLSFHGGLAGAIISVYLFCKKNKVSFLRLADILIVPVALILSIGRIVNWINLEIWGVVYNGPFCVNDTNNICRFPYQFAAALKRFFIFLVLIAASKRKTKPGFILLVFIFLSGLTRFFLDFLKDDARILLNLTTGQILSFFMVVISAFILIKGYIKLK